MGFNITKIFFLLLLSLVIYSCKKEKDEVKPVIVLDSPADKESFKVFDEIPISGTVEDDIHIEFVRISLLDENQKTAASGIAINPTGKKLNFTRGIALNDVNMESGLYYLAVTASDGINEHKLFRYVYISEASQKRKGIFVITSDGLTTRAELIDSTGLVNSYTSFYGDYSGSAISAYYQTLSVAGSKTGDMTCINLSDKSVKWKIPTTHQSYPTFTNIEYIDRWNHLSYYEEGTMKAYFDNGSVRTNFKAINGFYSKKLINMDTHLISYQESFTGEMKKLVTYNKSTGLFYHDLSVAFEVVDFCQLTGMNVLAFGNQENAGVLKIYNSNANNERETIALPAGKITCAAKLNENEYMFSNENGLYIYYYMSNSTSLFKSGNFTHFVYDDLNDEVIAVTNNQILLYNYNSGTLISTYSFGGEVRKVLPWYNK